MSTHEIEFVDRELAEAEASRAINLMNASDDSRYEACFALKSVADLYVTESNVGISGISWKPDQARSRGKYVLWAQCTKGNLNTACVGPATLEEARRDPHLSRAVSLYRRGVERKGGLVATRPKRPNGTGDALVAAVSASEAGREWLSRPNARVKLLQMVRIADEYGREGVCPFASFESHLAFLTFENRNELVRRFPTSPQAIAKVMSMRNGDEVLPGRRRAFTDSQVSRLVARSGVPARCARELLRAASTGTSKMQFSRAVNESLRMVESGEVLATPHSKAA